MDWSNVTGEELLEALREVEWAAPPRSPKEFFAKFTPPKTGSKWASRMKCNAYFYRTNYVLIVLLTLTVAFYRNPWALLAMLLMMVSVLCLNDTFANSLSERLLKLMRKISPQLAAKLRNAGSSNLNLAPSRSRRGKMFIVGAPRSQVVGVTAGASALIMYLCGGLWTICGALFLAFGFIFLHATMRTPNLKARLASAREEFRAVWRGYNDYTI